MFEPNLDRFSQQLASERPRQFYETLVYPDRWPTSERRDLVSDSPRDPDPEYCVTRGCRVELQGDDVDYCPECREKLERDEI